MSTNIVLDSNSPFVGKSFVSHGPRFIMCLLFRDKQWFLNDRSRYFFE